MTIPLPGVLSNDTDPNGDTLTAVLVSGPANGTLTLNPNGSFTFVPNPGFIGSDSFTCRASDGSALSLPVTVSLFVLPGGNLGPAPQVTSFARFGFHQMPTSFFVQFNTALDPASAVDLSNYILVTPGRDGRFGTRDDRRVALRSATYDSALLAVTLDAGRRLDLYAQYQLTVRGSLRAAGGATGNDQLIRISQLSLAGRSNVPIPDREPLARQIQLVRLPQGNGRIFAARGRLFQALRRQFR